MAEIKKRLSHKQIEQYQKSYRKNPINPVLESAIRTSGIDTVALDPKTANAHLFVFNHECRQGEPTNQKQSGRCWYFAALNSLRQLVMDKLNTDSFEFSQTHLYFFDKMEKANTFLERVIKTAEKPLDDREVMDILESTSYDGGFWTYFKPLCLKYGLVPKSVASESFHSEASYMFTKQLDYRLKIAACEIRKAKEKGEKNKKLREIKDKALASVYEVCCKCLGEPVESFEFSYMDKDKKYQHLDKMTPVEFFEKYVGQEELEKRVVLIADPRDIHPHGRLLISPEIKNVYDADAAGGLNVPIEVLCHAVLESVKAGVPVWFACDVGKDIHRKKGILDTKLYRYDDVLNETGDFSKKDRFAYGYSRATHAMNITGVETDQEGKPLYWKVENSWGDEQGKKGTYSMSHDWMLEYTYEAIIEKRFIPKKWLSGLDKEAIELSLWDHITRLA